MVGVLAPAAKLRKRVVATLLMKVFAVDVMACPRCDSRMLRIAVIQRPSVIEAILDCIKRKEQPP